MLLPYPRARRAALLPLLLVLSACYMPAPVTHAALVVSDTGTYTLDTVVVPGPDLATALAARRVAAANLRIDLHASPQAGMPAIEFAVAAARQAQVKVDFTHDTPAPSAPK